MKALKLFFIVWALTVFAKPLFSQRLIFRGGLTVSTISFTDEYEKNVKLGFSFNTGYEIKLKPNIYLQPEIGVVSKGSNFAVSLQDRKLSIYYLELSLPAKLIFGNKFHVLLAPTISVGIDGKVTEYALTSNTYGVKFESYPESGYDQAYHAYIDNRVDFGAQVGAGVELWKNVIIDIRYTHGFTRLYTDFSNRGDFNNEPNKNAKNRSIQFTIGIPLKVGKARDNS